MALALIPPTALSLIGACLNDSEDSGALCELGRFAILTGDAALLAQAKGAFDDLWARRDALLLEEFLWSAGNTPSA